MPKLLFFALSVGSVERYNQGLLRQPPMTRLRFRLGTCRLARRATYGYDSREQLCRDPPAQQDATVAVAWIPGAPKRRWYARI